MTRAEAIICLKGIKNYGRDTFTEQTDWQKSLDIAIKALEQTEIVRCKDCTHRILNENYGKKGYMNLKATCELDTGDPFELGRNAEDDDWFCGDAERRTDGENS